MMTIVLDAAYDMMEGGDPLWFRLTDRARQSDSDALLRRGRYVRLVEQALEERIAELATCQGYEVEVWTIRDMAEWLPSVVTTSTPRPGDEEYRTIEMDLWQEAWDTIDLEAIRSGIES